MTVPTPQPVSPGAPPTQPFGGPGSRAAVRPSRLTLPVALLALVLSVISLIAAGYAIAKADGTRTVVSANAGPGAGAGGQAPSNPTTGANPLDANGTPLTPTPGASSDELDPKATYAVKYSQQRLTLRVSCARTIGVDLDEPRVDVDDQHADMTAAMDCSSSQPVFRFTNGVSASPAASASATANDCVESIRTGPYGSDAQVPVTRQLAVCVATSRDAANTQGITRKIVLISVAAINSLDNSVDIVASAWDVPR